MKLILVVSARGIALHCRPRLANEQLSLDKDFSQKLYKNIIRNAQVLFLSPSFLPSFLCCLFLSGQLDILKDASADFQFKF